MIAVNPATMDRITERRISSHFLARSNSRNPGKERAAAIKTMRPPSPPASCTTPNATRGSDRCAAGTADSQCSPIFATIAPATMKSAHPQRTSSDPARVKFGPSKEFAKRPDARARSIEPRLARESRTPSGTFAVPCASWRRVVNSSPYRVRHEAGYQRIMCSKRSRSLMALIQ